MKGGDLTTSSAVKRWLGLSGGTDDDVIGSLVTAVSRAIAADLGRSALVPTLCTEELDGDGSSELSLTNWPVTQVISCVIRGQLVPTSSGATDTGVRIDPGTPSPPGAPQRLIYHDGVFPHGRCNVVVLYRAGYQINDETAQVPLVAPFSVPALAPNGAWANDVDVAGAQGPYDVRDGLYTFTAADAGASIRLSYGYVPADLEQAAIEWVADRYMARARVGQASKTLGGQETVSFIVKAMPDVVSRLLQPYRRVSG